MVAPRAPIVRLVCMAAFAGCTEFSIEDTDDTLAPGAVIEETFVPNPLPRVDILWVLDNTASMAEELAHLRANSSEFLDSLDEKEVSWHMALVATETNDDEFGVLFGNPWVVTPSMPTASDDFADLFDVDLAKSAEGAGLFVALAALHPERLDDENRGFRRPNAALHVVVVSDEDDGSDERMDGDPADAFVDELAHHSETTGFPAVCSAIVGPQSSGCIGQAGRALPGRRYIDVAQRTGGSVQSICNPDLASVAGRVAELSAPLETRFALQGTPTANGTAVWVDGVRTATGWHIDPGGPALVFERPPQRGALIRIRYTVMEP